MLLPLLCLLSLTELPQFEEMRRIVPLHSTRTEVERVLGAPSGNCKCLYERESVNVQIQYSSGDCQNGESGGWDVPLGTVIRFTVYTKKRPYTI